MEKVLMGTLGALDWFMVVLYIGAVFAVAIWVSRRAKTRETPAGYFLGDATPGGSSSALRSSCRTSAPST